MIPGTAGESSKAVLAGVAQLLSGVEGRLEVTSGDLLGLVDAAQLDRHLTKLLGERPGMFDSLLVGLGGLGSSGSSHHPFDILPSAKTMGMVLGHLKIARQQAQYANRKADIQGALNGFVIRRHVAGLTEREKALVRGYAAMYADGGVSLMKWHNFFTLMTWAAGAGDIQLPTHARSNKHGAEAKEMLGKLVGTALPSHENFLSKATADLGAYKAKSAEIARLIGDALSTGARWFELADVASSRVYSTMPSPASLLIGYAGEAKAPLYFGGSESLITFGGPRAGKTQGQVIPNLLRYPGSAFVLDVKGELWAETAEQRRRFGPVYRFAPTDPNGSSAKYNPFDAIDADPGHATIDAQVMASELIPPNPNLKDPYWENKARDVLWGFITFVALNAPPEKRNLSEVSRYLNMRINYEDDERAYKLSPMYRAVKLIRSTAESAGLHELEGIANAIDGGITGTRLENVFDSARSHLSAITRTPWANAAMSASDWRPADLRTQPGTTVYLCLKPGELRAFAPLVRIIFQQHVDALTRDFTHRDGSLPVTFFLDEMPQLGLMPGLSDIIDVGRGAGLRLWMFAQYLGQIREIYGAKADGLINACAVRCFMQPDTDAAKFIEPQLGNTRNILNNEKRPLAEQHDLMGRAFADMVVTLARAEHPARLSKVMAYEQRFGKVA